MIFLVEKLIYNSGAYGKVYKGFLKSTGIFVAIKEMT